MITKPSNSPKNKGLKEKSRGIYIPRVNEWKNFFSQRLLFTATLLVMAITEMQSQQSNIFPKNKMNLIESEAETRGAASAIIYRVRQKDSITTRAFRGSVDTQNLTAYTTIIPYAPLPTDLDTGTASQRIIKYHQYTRSVAPYDTGNGRPDTDPDDNNGEISTSKCTSECATGRSI